MATIDSRRLDGPCRKLVEIRVSARPTRARTPRYRPSTDERPQNSVDGKEKNDMASLVIRTPRAAFYSALGCGYLRAPVGCRAAREVPAMKPLLSDKGLHGERTHLSGTVENSEFVLDGAEVIKGGSQSEQHTEDEVTSAAFIFFPI
jgi:hypothetical protein